MTTSRKKLVRGAFLVAIILGCAVSVYLLSGNQNQPVKTADQAKPIAESTTDTTESFFQKPDAATNTVTPTPVKNKTAAELEQTMSTQNSTPSDYNLLATTYYQQGDKEKAKQTIIDGLLKFPNDKTLSQTQDLIDNILPNL